MSYLVNESNVQVIHAVNKPYVAAGNVDASDEASCFLKSDMLCLRGDRYAYSLVQTFTSYFDGKSTESSAWVFIESKE